MWVELSVVGWVSNLLKILSGSRHSSLRAVPHARRGDCHALLWQGSQ
ncbi:MAG: hypothetical protein IKI11_04190 [Neisseriaceae bacterium]|nr:hypothetical protein [Neisseriaceae bacterium]